MNATRRFAARTGLGLCSALALALTGCRTHVVQRPTRTVYVHAAPPFAVVEVPPAPVAQTPPPVIAVPPPDPEPVVIIRSENDFYESLAPYGRWVVVGSYGRCWVPARVEAGWRPYENGYWQRTDAGWYWASDEPWGWATYHYGRWDFSAEFGWIWVPQTQWAPAWVAWREGGGYVGWAPLRPSVAIGVNVTRVDYEPAFASRAFVFVEQGRMLEPVRPRSVAVNNTVIVNQTVNITNVKVVNQRVINEGPRPDVIERESGRKVQAVPVREFRRREETAVIARERKTPTFSDRKVVPPARNQSQVVESKTVPPPITRAVEKPAPVVTHPVQPAVMPVRPVRTASPQPEAKSPVREERKVESEVVRIVTTPSPTVAPNAAPNANPPQTAPQRNEVRHVAKPTTVARPTPQPVTTAPSNRDDKKRERPSENRNPTPPPAVDNRSRQAVRPEATREEKSKPAVKVETVSPAAVTKKALAEEKSNDERLMSPREKSRTRGPDQADQKKR